MIESLMEIKARQPFISAQTMKLLPPCLTVEIKMFSLYICYLYLLKYAFVLIL